MTGRKPRWRWLSRAITGSARHRSSNSVVSGKNAEWTAFSTGSRYATRSAVTRRTGVSRAHSARHAYAITRRPTRSVRTSQVPSQRSSMSSPERRKISSDAGTSIGPGSATTNSDETRPAIFFAASAWLRIAPPYQRVGLGIGNDAVKEFVGALRHQLLADFARERHRGVRWPRTDAHSRHAEPLEFRRWRCSRSGEDVYRTFYSAHQRRDRFRVAHARDEETVGAGFAVGVGASDRMFVAARLLADSEQENVGARVDHERNAGRIGGVPRGADPLDRDGQVVKFALRAMDRVLEVHPDCAGLDDHSHGLAEVRRVARETGLHICRDGHLDALRDSRDRGHHHVERYDLAVGIAECVSDAGAGGCDGLEADSLEDARTRGVPCVGEYEDALVVVHAAKRFCFFSLKILIHSWILHEYSVPTGLSILIQMGIAVSKQVRTDGYIP